MKVDLKKIESLSKIRVEAADRNRIWKEIVKILNFADSIKSYKLEDALNIGSVNDLQNILREDGHKNNQGFFNRETIFGNIPQQEKCYVKVPKILKAK